MGNCIRPDGVSKAVLDAAGLRLMAKELPLMESAQSELKLEAK